MPFYRKPRNFTPLQIAAEKKTYKNGIHHSIFTSKFDKYIGDWKDNRKEGKGLFQTINGKLYEGDWHKGFRHGNGTLSYRLPSGLYKLEYRGEWVRGKPEGVGWRYYDNGDVYFGFWKQGYCHGYGKMWYSDGTFYVGYWDMKHRDGLGMIVQMNGNRYEGNWCNNIKSGLGRFYHMHTGQVQIGCWVDDVCVKSKMEDILIRQCCDMPTEYPIPKEELQNSKRILEQSQLWLAMRLGDLDKKLQLCIDQMD